MDALLVKDYISEYLRRETPVLVPREIKLKLRKGKALSIIGPRRAGKTSFMWEVIPTYNRNETIYMDFEDIALRGLSATEVLRVVTEIFTEVSGKNAKNVFLDEIQNIDGWQSLVRTLLDREYVVFVTGSTSKLLAKEIATQLRGRSVSVLLLPFSFTEFIRAKKSKNVENYNFNDVGKVKNMLTEYLNFGGYPEVVFEQREKGRLIQEYKELIFFKDFVERHEVKSIEVARFIFSFVTQCFANEMSVRNVVNALRSNGISFGSNTVYDYVDKLQDTMIFFFLDRFSAKVKLRTGWPKKVYLADNGLAWKLSEDRGRLMENAVFLELKRRQALSPTSELYYYNNGSGGEVDFVVRSESRIEELIQVTYASGKNDVKERELKSLIKASDELQCKKLTIITWDYAEAIALKGKNILCKPMWQWLTDK